MTWCGWLRAGTLLGGLALAAQTPPQDALAEELRWLQAERFTVVTASRYAQTRAEAPAKVVVWTREMIRQCGFQTLEEVLENTPGVYWSFNTDYANYAVRGMAPQAPGLPQPNILFLLDGVRLNEATFFGHYYSYWHHLDNVRQIEIVLGPGGAQYGLNALAGVVHILTERPPADGGHAFQANLSMETPLNAGRAYVRHTYASGDAFATSAALDLPLSTQGTWDTGVPVLKTVTWYQKSPWHHGLERSEGSVPNWDVRVRLGALEFFTYRTSVLYPEFNVPWWDATAPRTRSFEKRIFELAWKPGILDAEIRVNYNQHWDFHASQGRTLWAPYAPAPGAALWGLTQVNERLLSGQASPVRTADHHLLVAFETSRAERDANFLGDPLGRSQEQVRHSVLAQWENRMVADLALVAGLRYDTVRVDSRDPAQNARKALDTFNALSPRLSANYRVGERQRLRLVAARSFRQYVLGDFLDREWAARKDYVDDVELGYHLDIPQKVALDVNLFHMRAPYSNLAINDNFFPPKGRTPFTSRGLEADLSARLGRWAWSAGFTWWDARTGQMDEAGIGRMLNVPRSMLKVGMRGELVPGVLHLAVLASGNFGLLHVDDLSGTGRRSWNYAPVNVVFSSHSSLRPYVFAFGIKNAFQERFDYPGYGSTAPFAAWNVPDHMVTDSRLHHPGLMAFFKFGIEI